MCCKSSVTSEHSSTAAVGAYKFDDFPWFYQVRLFCSHRMQIGVLVHKKNYVINRIFYLQQPIVGN